MSTEGWGLLLRLAVFLPLVLILSYASVRFGLGRRGLATGPGLKVVDQVSLGNKAALVVVQAGDTYYLLTVGSDGVKMLKELPDYPERQPAPRTLLAHWETVREVFSRRFGAGQGKSGAALTAVVPAVQERDDSKGPLV